MAASRSLRERYSADFYAEVRAAGTPRNRRQAFLQIAELLAQPDPTFVVLDGGDLPAIRRKALALGRWHNVARELIAASTRTASDWWTLLRNTDFADAQLGATVDDRLARWESGETGVTDDLVAAVIISVISDLGWRGL